MPDSIKFDITILTDRRYVAPVEITPYIQNVLEEDRLLSVALKDLGLRVTRINWDNPDFDWAATRYVIFRTTWDYFDRFDEFSIWLEYVCTQTKLINPKALIYWNLDKHYLQDLERNGIRIPKSHFIERGEQRSFNEIVSATGWEELVLKPSISGAARHTYRFTFENHASINPIFDQLIKNESLILQEFQRNILTKGEVAYILFAGKFSHAILKKGKAGDFRVQDDFGGTLEIYTPNDSEIEFVEKAILQCNPQPVYARVDVVWNNEDELCIGEIELIEPELWFRLNEHSATQCALAISEAIRQ